MSPDFPSRKSGEHGSRIRPSFANRNWQHGPVAWTGRGPQTQIFADDRHKLPDWNERLGRKTLQDGTVAGRCFPRPTHTDLHKEIRMDDEIEIQDLEAYEIRELLLDQGSEVDEEQAAAIKQFIEDIGGLENALAAVDMLDSLQKAA